MNTYTLSGVLNWLENGAGLTAAELEALGDLVAKKLEYARQTEAIYARALLELDIIARNAGAKNTRDLIAKLDGAPRPDRTKPGRKKGGAKEVRKPYMNPFDPDSALYALAEHHPKPAWVADLLKRGWTKSELHYAQHKQALAARGEPILYDAPKRHKALVAAELAKHSG